MSIERTPRGQYRVRYRQGGRNRSKVTGPRKADAIAFEAEVKRNLRIGSIVPDEMGKELVWKFGQVFDDRHISRKAPKTRTLYRYLWDKHILPTFGPGRLSDVTVGMTPYALRHSFASLLIAEGKSVVEVAAQLGHSPQVCLSVYTHVFSELGGTGSAEDAIRQARIEVSAERKAESG